MTLRAGQTILHRYVTLHPLGKGAMGEVWKGEHRDLEMPVAIKILSHPDQKALVARFRQEAKLMSKLRHPNVVQIFDFGLLDDGVPCIVMEYLEGTPLDDVIASSRPDWRDALRYVIAMVEGLDAIHAAGIVHRDVKPENSMLLRDGTLKIVDLGIAKPSAPMGGMKLTQTGTMIGTPYYMAPEQLLGQDTGPCTDLYAVGIILYEMLSTSVPWNDGTMGSILQRLRHPIPKLVLRDPFCPEVLSQLTMRLLEFEASRRPTAKQVLALCREVLEVSPQKVALERATVAPIPADDAPSTGSAPLAMTFKRKRRRTPREEPETARSAHSPDPRPRVQNQPKTRPGAESSPLLFEQTLLATPAPEDSSIKRTRSTTATPIPMPSDEHEPERIRAALAVKLPPSRLRMRPERAWLKSLLAGRGTGFTLGGQFWIAVVKAHGDDAARAIVAELEQALQERYAHLATSRHTLVSERFELTPAIISGAQELPDEIRQLIQAVLLES